MLAQKHVEQNEGGNGRRTRSKQPGERSSTIRLPHLESKSASTLLNMLGLNLHVQWSIAMRASLQAGGAIRRTGVQKVSGKSSKN
jgi:hypothetical protein